MARGLGNVAVVLLLGAATAALAASCRKQINLGVDDLGVGMRVEVDVRRLSNGLTVVMVEDRSVPVVSYQTWFRVGSVDEAPGATGMAHLFEHLMFKGTSRNGPRTFFQRLEARGAEVNAYTTRDYTVYTNDIVPQLLPLVAELEADRMTGLVLSDESLAVERQVVLEERRLRVESDPGGLIQEALWGLAFRRHPYQWPVIGRPEDVALAHPDAIRAFYRRHYVPSNAAVVLVGDFAADEAFRVIAEKYGSIPKGPVPRRDIADEPEQKGERRLTLRERVTGERFAWAYHVTSAEQDDSFALDVLANILFEGASSRGYRRLVEEADLCLGVTGSAYTPTFPGLFIVGAAMKAGVPAERAEQELEGVIRAVEKDGVTEEEVAVAVRQLTVQLVDGVRTRHGLARLIGTVMTVLGDPKRFDEDLKKYLKVTPADVKRVAGKYLVPNNRSVVTLVPK